jgi:hypothetical protein
MTNRLIRMGQAYLLRKDRENAIKKQEEKIKQIVKELLLDKTPKQAIEMRNEVAALFDDKIDEKLRESIETVEAINKYRKIKK